MPLSEEQLEELKADLSPSGVSTRSQQGRMLSFIEGWWAIERANDIFGYDAWSTTTRRLEETGRTLVDTDRGKQWRVSFMAIVRITIGDIVRDGTGFGSGFAKEEQLGDAIESAIKEAETDAMKRAFRTFGNQFGNALYDKSQANVEGTPANLEKRRAKAQARTLYTELSDEITAADSVDALEILYRDRIRDIKSLPADWERDILGEFSARKATLGMAA